MILDKFNLHEDCSSRPVYSLTDIQSKSQVKSLGDDGYLALIIDEDKVEFAIFVRQYTDQRFGTMPTLQFHGKGLSGALRECRHTYWGEDGYIFYPNGKVISEAFKELSIYFDDMY